MCDVLGRRSPSKGVWAQVTPTEPNVAYPLANSPERELGEMIGILSGAELLSWEPREFATWAFDYDDPSDLAKAVDVLLTRLFQLREYTSMDA